MQVRSVGDMVKITSSYSKANTSTDESGVKQDEIAGIIGTESESNSVSEKSVIDAIEKTNKLMINHNTRAEFSVHRQTKTIMVKIIDTDENTVIREFPPEKILDMIAKLWEMAGIFVDERR